MSKQFSTVAWAKAASIYEVNIRQYTLEGSFNSFAHHLPRLKEMGITIIWLMPITPISIKERLGSLGSYYACSSYTTINPEYGSLDDFKALVKQAHALGLKLIIDWVANHTGWDHHWTTEHPDWYIHDEQGNFTEKNGWEDVIDLNYTNQDMRQAMIEAMRYWITECDIDGFRCDMAHLVTLDFWKQARESCDTLKPLFWLAECEVVEYHTVFDTSYAWAWMHATENQVKGSNSLQDVWNVLHGYTQYPEGSQKLFFTTNHDENSWNGTEYEKYGIAAKAWAVFTCTWQGMPLIYSGQESPNLKRLKFFDKDPIQWNQPLEMARFYETLLSFRKSNLAIMEGETFILPTSEHANRLIAFIRKKGKDCVLVLLNISKDDRIQIEIDNPWLNGTFYNIFSGMHFNFSGKQVFELQGGELVVYSLKSN